MTAFLITQTNYSGSEQRQASKLHPSVDVVCPQGGRDSKEDAQDWHGTTDWMKAGAVGMTSYAADEAQNLEQWLLGKDEPPR